MSRPAVYAVSVVGGVVAVDLGVVVYWRWRVRRALRWWASPAAGRVVADGFAEGFARGRAAREAAGLTPLDDEKETPC